jgi:hypothetical protein
MIVLTEVHTCCNPGHTYLHSDCALLEQGCQIFLGTTYQNGTKYTKWPQNIPNGRKMYLHNPPNPPKFTKIGIFVLKTNHLATLV